MVITSTSNPAVKRAALLQKQSKARRREGCFPAEGLRLCREIPAGLLETLYVCPELAGGPSGEAQSEWNAFAQRAASEGIPVVEVSAAAMRAMSDTPAPQGVLGICRMPAFSAEEIFSGNGGRPRLLLLLENIQDPGNLGTMFRTAEGAGCDGIILSRGCVDPYSPKVVRSTMGSLFRVPHLVAEDFAGAIAGCRQRGVRLFAADLRGAVDYDTADYTGSCGFLVGNEGNGLTEETALSADARIRIPMGGQLESLNAAMSAGILMYECRRQRRCASGLNSGKTIT